jgi:hypothetical protein
MPPDICHWKIYSRKQESHISCIIHHTSHTHTHTYTCAHIYVHSMDPEFLTVTAGWAVHHKKQNTEN